MLDKLNDPFGIELCNEKYMMGVHHERWIENGIRFNRLDQIACETGEVSVACHHSHLAHVRLGVGIVTPWGNPPPPTHA